MTFDDVLKQEKYLFDEGADAAGSSAPAGLADLLSCPFCGCTAPGPQSGVYMIAKGVVGQAVRCPTCNANGPACPTFEQAMAQWNQRKPNTQAEARVLPSPPAGCSADDPRTYACDHCDRLRNKAEGGNIFTLCDECWDKHFKKPNAPAEARIQPSHEVGCSVAELTDGIQQAISMLMGHIDKYHDCDVPENTEGPPERKALQNIMHHLMGTITPNAPAHLPGKESNEQGA